MHARYTLAHTKSPQRYKKKLTYTIVYAIFLHFSAKNPPFYPSFGNAALPESVIRPRCSSSAQRRIFKSVQ